MSERLTQPFRSGVRRVDAARYGEGVLEACVDEVAVEEPLEIRIAGEPLAVTMRTPGHDHELVAGFLLAEGIIRSRADLGSLAHCGRTGDEGYENVIDVAAAPGSVLDTEWLPRRRGTLTTSACGVCGRRTIDDLLARCDPLASGLRIVPDVLAAIVESLSFEQPNFRRTGGLHAAGLARPDGSYRAVREDVGRHNAVDKLLGRLVLDDELPAAENLLVVSGRTSFEIVQKALVARIPIVVGVSAPSSLAVATALRANMTLVGFARSGRFNAYAGSERVG